MRYQEKGKGREKEKEKQNKKENENEAVNSGVVIDPSNSNPDDRRRDMEYDMIHT